MDTWRKEKVLIGFSLAEPHLAVLQKCGKTKYIYLSGFVLPCIAGLNKRCSRKCRTQTKEKLEQQYWPADVALAQVLVWGGLLDEELHLCWHIQRFVMRKVSTCREQTCIKTLDLWQKILIQLSDLKDFSQQVFFWLFKSFYLRKMLFLQY